MTAQYQYVTDTGTIVADTADVKASVEAEFQAALGANIDLAPSTPQGTLIAAETLARTNVMKTNAELANVMNPETSYGVFLDAIASLLGISRGANKATQGTGIIINGDSGTVIPAGSRVSTTNNDIFLILADVTIPLSGLTTANIQSQQYGQIALPIGSLNIIDGTIGWAAASVDNTAVVTLGLLALLDPQFKNKRRQQLAIQGVGSSAAIKAAALDVANVTSVQVVENNTGVIGVVNGVTFTLPNAMWVCVDGTYDHNELAQALYEAHNGGTPWDYGVAGDGTPVSSPDGIAAVDAATGLKYNVKYTSPILYDCYVNITIAQGNSPTSPQPAVQNAIFSYANGNEDGEDGLVVGASVSAFEMAGAVSRQLPGLYIKSCSVCCVLQGVTPPVYPNGYGPEVVMPQFSRAVIQLNNVKVNIT